MDSIRTDQLEGIRAQLGHVVSGARDAESDHDAAPDVDIRDYLLEPPPTPGQIARHERRRTLVRRGSLAAAGFVAVILLAPMPGGTDPRSTDRSAADATVGLTNVVTSAPGPSEALPRRLDTPPARARTRPNNRLATSRRGARARIVRTAPINRPTEAASQPHGRSTSPSSTPTTVVDAPPLAGDAGILVPVM